MVSKLEKIVGGAMAGVGGTGTVTSAIMVANDPQNIINYAYLVASLGCAYYGLDILAKGKDTNKY